MTAMSDHFTLRFPPSTTTRLQRRARATGSKPRTLAARYVEEGIRRDDHPLIRFADGPSGRRAALAGSPLDIWEVIATVRDNENDVVEASEYLRIAPALVEAALAYYGEFKDEIDREIAINAEESARAHAAWLAGHDALA
jgi:hypothetical protein